jgi:hypothetical protein
MRRVVSIMAPTKREKAFCVLEFAKHTTSSGNRYCGHAASCMGRT